MKLTFLFIKGKGINLSVLLYDLKKLQTLNCTEQVKATTMESVIKRFSFQVAYFDN